ncbi:unnamed protein product, partial [Amoebophrya sp. A120]
VELGPVVEATTTKRTSQENNKTSLTSEEPTQQESSWIQAKPSFSSTRGIVPQLLSGQVAGRAQQAQGASKNGLQHDGGTSQLRGGADSSSPGDTISSSATPTQTVNILPDHGGNDGTQLPSAVVGTGTATQSILPPSGTNTAGQAATVAENPEDPLKNVSEEAKAGGSVLTTSLDAAAQVEVSSATTQQVASGGDFYNFPGGRATTSTPEQAAGAGGTSTAPRGVLILNADRTPSTAENFQSNDENVEGEPVRNRRRSSSGSRVVHFKNSPTVMPDVSRGGDHQAVGSSVNTGAQQSEVKQSSASTSSSGAPGSTSNLRREIEQNAYALLNKPNGTRSSISMT